MWSIITENLDMVLTIVFALLGMFTIGWVAISRFLSKIAKVSEQGAEGLKHVSEALKSFGLGRASSIVKAGADVMDELGDVTALAAEKTADGTFTKDEAKQVLKEGKELVIEGKEFIHIIKKKDPLVKLANSEEDEDAWPKVPTGN